MEAESRGPPLAGVGGAASGSGDENRPSVCSRASRRAQTPPDRADPRHPASRISMPPSCGDANQAISRAKIRDTGGADTGGAEDGGTDTGSADAGSVRDDGAGGATGGGDGGDGATGDGGSAGGDDFSAKISSSPNEAVSSPERDASSSSSSSSSSLSSSSLSRVRHGQATQQADGNNSVLP